MKKIFNVEREYVRSTYLMPLYLKERELSEQILGSKGNSLRSAYQIYLEFEQVRESIQAFKLVYLDLCR